MCVADLYSPTLTVLSTVPLVDDVSTDPLQRAARLADAALVTFPFAAAALIVAAKNGDVPREFLPAAFAAKSAIAVALALRLTLPFADVLTLADVRSLPERAARACDSLRER